MRDLERGDARRTNFHAQGRSAGEEREHGHSLPLHAWEAESLEEELQLVEEKVRCMLAGTCQCFCSRDKMPQAAATTSQAATRRAEQRQQLETLENELCRDCNSSVLSSAGQGIG